MAKEKYSYSYYYFSEPIKEEYDVSDERKPILKFNLNGCDISIYSDNEERIDMVKVYMDRPKDEPDLIANAIKSYIQSILRLSYALDFRISSFSAVIK